MPRGTRTGTGRWWRSRGRRRCYRVPAPVVPGIQGTGQADEGLGEVGIQAPVALLVGVGEGIAGDAAAQSHMIEFILVCPQADLDIAQALAVGELGEGQAEELVEAGKGLDVAVAVITPDAAAEAVHGQVGHEL